MYATQVHLASCFIFIINCHILYIYNQDDNLRIIILYCCNNPIYIFLYTNAHLSITSIQCEVFWKRNHNVKVRNISNDFTKIVCFWYDMFPCQCVFLRSKCSKMLLLAHCYHRDCGQILTLSLVNIETNLMRN